MRAMLLLALLMVAACSIREGTFAPSAADPDGLSLAPRNPNVPLRTDGDLACPGGFAQDSRIEEDRDGSANLFCD